MAINALTRISLDAALASPAAASEVAAALNRIDGVTAGTPSANQALVANASGGLATLTVGTLTSGSQKWTITSLNAANSAINNAAALSAGFNLVGAADNTKAVILPVAAEGLVVIVKSTVASKTLPVFPQVNSAIDALGASNVFTMTASTSGASGAFIATNATQWYSIPCHQAVS